MVTTYPTIRNQGAEDAREISELDDLRTAWVASYRQKHAEADWWAEGFGPVEHSPDTQERVFRMAEQLVGRGIDRLAVFAWAIFELAARAEDAATQLSCDCHPSFRPVPLGVAVASPSPNFMNAEWQRSLRPSAEG